MLSGLLLDLCIKDDVIVIDVTTLTEGFAGNVLSLFILYNRCWKEEGRGKKKKKNKLIVNDELL